MCPPIKMNHFSEAPVYRDHPFASDHRRRGADEIKAALRSGLASFLSSSTFVFLSILAGLSFLCLTRFVSLSSLPHRFSLATGVYFAHAVVPTNCTNVIYTTPQTIVFDPDDQGPYTVKLTRCSYLYGLTITASKAGALKNVTFIAEDVRATSVSLTSSIVVDLHSSFTFIRPTATSKFTTDAQARNGGSVTITHFSPKHDTTFAGSYTTGSSLTIEFLVSSSAVTIAANFTNSSLRLLTSTIEIIDGFADALTVLGAMTSSLFHVDSSTIASYHFYSVLVNSHVTSGSVHLWTRNNLYSTETVYSKAVVSYGFTKVLPGGLLHFAGNTFSQARGEGYVLHAVSAGGQIIHEDTNHCSSGGVVEVSTTALTTFGHTLHFKNYTALDTLSLSDTSSGNSLPHGHSVAITNSSISDTLAIEMSGGSNASLLLASVTASTIVANFSGPNTFARVAVHRVTSTTATFSGTIPHAAIGFTDNTFNGAFTCNYGTDHGTILVARNVLNNASVFGGFIANSRLSFIDNGPIGGPFEFTTSIKDSEVIFRNNTIAAKEAADTAFGFRSPGAITGSTFVFDSNWFEGVGGLNMAATVSIGLNSTIWLRRNTIMGMSLAALTLRLSGGTVNLDSSNTLRIGAVSIIHEGSSANNFVELVAQSIAGFSYTYSYPRGLASTSSNDVVRVRKGAITQGAATVVNFGAARGSSFVAEDVDMSGSFGATMVGAAGCILMVLGGSIASTATFAGSLFQNSRISLVGVSTRNVVTLSASTAYAPGAEPGPCAIEFVSNTMISPTNCLIISGVQGSNAFLNVTGNTMVTTSMSQHPFQLNATVLPSNAHAVIAFNSISSKSASRASIYVSATASYSSGLDIWGNTLAVGGLAVVLSATLQYVNIISNSAPLYTITGSAPSVGGGRILACNTVSSGESYSSKDIGFTTISCQPSTTVTRCPWLVSKQHNQPVVGTTAAMLSKGECFDSSHIVIPDVEHVPPALVPAPALAVGVLASANVSFPMMASLIERETDDESLTVLRSDNCCKEADYECVVTLLTPKTLPNIDPLRPQSGVPAIADSRTVMDTTHAQTTSDSDAASHEAVGSLITVGGSGDLAPTRSAASPVATETAVSDTTTTATQTTSNDSVSNDQSDNLWRSFCTIGGFVLVVAMAAVKSRSAEEFRTNFSFYFDIYTVVLGYLGLSTGDADAAVQETQDPEADSGPPSTTRMDFPPWMAATFPPIITDVHKLRLLKEHITTESDFLALTREDLIKLGFPLGFVNRVKREGVPSSPHSSPVIINNNNYMTTRAGAKKAVRVVNSTNSTAAPTNQ